jgi:hypothetical protein
MNEYQYAFDKLLTLDSPDVEQIEQLEVRGADYYHELLDTLYDLVEKETATQPDIEGDGYYKGELVYDTWICPRCGTRYEIDYDEYEYCPKCGQHIDLDSLEQITNYIVKLERENFGLKEYKKHQEKANERRYHTGDESWHRGSVVAKKK